MLDPFSGATVFLTVRMARTKIQSSVTLTRIKTYSFVATVLTKYRWTIFAMDMMTVLVTSRTNTSLLACKITQEILY